MVRATASNQQAGSTIGDSLANLNLDDPTRARGTKQRLAIVNKERCKPLQCKLECKKVCPVNSSGASYKSEQILNSIFQ
ncbi:MAG: hypothetical protein MHMPM18_003027 [Marteilia pararefringens]